MIEEPCAGSSPGGWFLQMLAPRLGPESTDVPDLCNHIVPSAILGPGDQKLLMQNDGSRNKIESTQSPQSLLSPTSEDTAF